MMVSNITPWVASVMCFASSDCSTSNLRTEHVHTRSPEVIGTTPDQPGSTSQSPLSPAMRPRASIICRPLQLNHACIHVQHLDQLLPCSRQYGPVAVRCSLVMPNMLMQLEGTNRYFTCRRLLSWLAMACEHEATSHAQSVQGCC